MWLFKFIIKYYPPHSLKVVYHGTTTAQQTAHERTLFFWGFDIICCQNTSPKRVKELYELLKQKKSSIFVFPFLPLCIATMNFLLDVGIVDKVSCRARLDRQEAAKVGKAFASCVSSLSLLPIVDIQHSTLSSTLPINFSLHLISSIPLFLTLCTIIWSRNCTSCWFFFWVKEKVTSTIDNTIKRQSRRWIVREICVNLTKQEEAKSNSLSISFWLKNIFNYSIHSEADFEDIDV